MTATPVEFRAGSLTGAAPRSLTPTHWGMISFLISETAFFGTLIVTYLHFLGKDQTGPTPAILSLSLVIGTTLCLLTSSATVHVAEKHLRTGAQSAFRFWWFLTIVLG